MDQVFARSDESNELLQQVGYPRRLLRKLIVRGGVGPGSRVLDVGCGDGALARFVDQLGLRPTGVERAPDRLAALRATFPTLDWQSNAPGELSTVVESEFDLILVRDEKGFSGSLLSPSALRSTAELLSALRPGGTLAFLFRRLVGPEGALASHDGSCFLKHIESFPGECQTEEYLDGFPKGVLGRLVGSPRRPGLVAVTLTIPLEAVARTGWKRFAEIAARSRIDDCCPWAAQSDAVPRRSAA